MASSAIPNMNILTKLTASASDFTPFSLKPKSKSDPSSENGEKRPQKQFKPRKSDAERYSHDLNLFSWGSEESVVSDDESSSSADESDHEDEDDDRNSSSKPSSSSGRNSRTSSEKRRVRFRRQPKKSPPKGHNGRASIAEAKETTEPDSEPQVETLNGDQAKSQNQDEDMLSARNSPALAKVLLAKMCRELFTVPGDEPTCDDSDDDDNIIEASCGHSPTSLRTQLVTQFQSQDLPKKVEVDPVKSSPMKSLNNHKNNASVKVKDQEESAKSKLVNCPVCGKVVMEKSLKLQDHYDECHTPQRKDLNCLGYVPTHKHSDGSSIVRLNETERLVGNQCFICYRLCENPRQLRLHWQLHKVYVSLDEARLAADSEGEEGTDSADQCALEMTVEEHDHINHGTLGDLRLDIYGLSEDEILYANPDSTDEESETEVKRLRDEFTEHGIAVACRMECVKQHTTPKPKKRRKKGKGRSTPSKVEELTEQSKRCPDCDVVFGDAVWCSRHRLRDHGTKLMYRCVREECRKVFYHHGAYREHHRAEHRQRAFICSVCNDHFSVYGQLVSHRRRAHRFLAKQHPFPCANCQVRFPNGVMLANHEHRHRTHAQPMKLEGGNLASSGTAHCLICLAEFSDYSQFEEHVEEHFIKTYYCSDRGCVFTSENMHDMRRHLNFHFYHTESTRCPRCQKEFDPDDANLYNRRRRHYSSCAHRCFICSRNYVLTEELFVHFMKQHHFVRLVCPFCRESISSLVDFVEHQKSFHLAHHTDILSDKPRLNIVPYTSDVTEIFPQLLSTEFDNITNGFYAFVTLNSFCAYPRWWKASPERRLERVNSNSAKLLLLMTEELNKSSVDVSNQCSKVATTSLLIKDEIIEEEPSLSDHGEMQVDETQSTTSDSNQTRKRRRKCSKSEIMHVKLNSIERKRTRSRTSKSECEK